MSADDPDNPTRPGVVGAEVHRWEAGDRFVASDRLVVEEPCEIRLEGDPVAVVMRTPGHDRELAAGFLFGEGIVEPEDLGTIAHCPEAEALPEGPGERRRSDALRDAGHEPHPENVVEVRLAPGRSPRRGWQRSFFAVSSCGVCGKASIEAIRAEAPRLSPGPVVGPDLLQRLAERLAAEQEVFSETGGLHAAGIFSASGEPLVLREDVGRHNAVDKAVGHALLQERLPLSGHLLLVSGRASFEIVQKALRAGIPVVAAVSAASSLAVELATAAGMTLVGFVRPRRMVIYAGAERIDRQATPEGRDPGARGGPRADRRDAHVRPEDEP